MFLVQYKSNSYLCKNKDNYIASKVFMNLLVGHYKIRLRDCSFVILLSRESDGVSIFWTNPYSFRSCPCLSFPVDSLSSFQ